MDVIKVLVANKSDAQQLRVVDQESGRKLAEQYSVPFYECSCKSNVNIHEIFNEMTELIYKQYEQRVNHCKQPVIAIDFIDNFMSPL